MNGVVALNDVPTVSHLYDQGRLQRQSIATVPGSTAVNDKVGLIRYDITKLRVDCIVNAANESLLGGGGVDGAIHRAAGPELLRECRTLDGCETGSAKITDAYNLPCVKVIHAVGPIYNSSRGQNMSKTLLRGCYRRSLELAVLNQMRSIAFSALSTGVYGYPSGEAAMVALGEVKNFLMSDEGEKLDMVVFCNFETKNENAYIDNLSSVSLLFE
ncbi:MAG: hypothetical protein M1817_005166 [Caeruleum heppii]|nr:MAG: hypothetical protein M1817_005166 [Caeruleum heppii]